MKPQFLLLLCVMPLMSCTTIKNGIDRDVDESGTYEIKMQYISKNNSRLFIVNGVKAGKTLSALRGYLEGKKEGDVIFRAEDLLVSSEIVEFLELFREQSFHIKQFWVMSSFAPGWFDLLENKDEESLLQSYKAEN